MSGFERKPMMLFQLCKDIANRTIREVRGMSAEQYTLLVAVRAAEANAKLLVPYPAGELEQTARICAQWALNDRSAQGHIRRRVPGGRRRY